MALVPNISSVGGGAAGPEQQSSVMGQKVVLFIISLGVTLAAVELMLARFFPQKTMNFLNDNRAAMFIESETLGIALAPSFRGREREAEFDIAIEINSQGYRQPEFEREKGQRPRVLVIGDSFTFGVAVEGEEAYPRVLEQLLKTDAGEKVEVINAGVPARYVDEYYLELRERGLALEPDVVIVGFFVGNDIDGIGALGNVWTRVDENGLPLEIDRPDRIDDGYLVRRVSRRRWYLPVIRNSHIAQLLYETGRRIHQLVDPPRLKVDSIYEPIYDHATEQLVERVEELFLVMAQVTRESGADFLVVMIPAREQVYAGRWQGGERFDWDKPQRIFTKFFTDADISFIDLLPLFGAAPDGDALYFEDDKHWSSRGHAVAAAAIAQRLDQRGTLRTTTTDPGLTPGA